MNIKIYQSGLKFMLCNAVKRLYDGEVEFRHSLDHGICVKIFADTKITMTGEIGSFKFTELSGTISEFEMTWADGTKKVLKQNEKIGNWIEFYSDNKCTKPLKVANIKKNQT